MKKHYKIVIKSEEINTKSDNNDDNKEKTSKSSNNNTKDDKDEQVNNSRKMSEVSRDSDYEDLEDKVRKQFGVHSQKSDDEIDIPDEPDIDELGNPLTPRMIFKFGNVNNEIPQFNHLEHINKLDLNPDQIKMAFKNKRSKQNRFLKKKSFKSNNSSSSDKSSHISDVSGFLHNEKVPDEV